MSFAQLIEDHNLYTQRAHLALLAEQIVIEGLKEEIRALTIQSGASCLPAAVSLCRSTDAGI